MNIGKFTQNILDHGSGVHSINHILPSNVGVINSGFGRMSGAFKTMQTKEARRVFLETFVLDFINDRTEELLQPENVLVGELTEDGVLTLDIGHLVRP